MMDLEFSFESSPWEELLEELSYGDTLSAARFLTAMEDEGEDALQEALLSLEERHILLDISQLPKPTLTGEAAVRLRLEAQLVEQGRLLEGLEENDPLRLFLEEIAALPAFGDVQKMAERYASGLESVIPNLTNRMLSHVVEMACDLTGHGVLLLDLIQEGSLGLWQGILSYREGAFEPHARWWIRQYLSRAVTLQARESGFGQRMKQAMEDYRSMDEELLTQLGRNPTLAEIAEAMHISEDEARTVADMLESARRMQKDHPQPEEAQEDPQEDQAVEDTAYFQARQRIADLLALLGEREAAVLKLRFGLEGGRPLSPEETGRKLGMTASEVVAMEGAALSVLRGNQSE